MESIKKNMDPERGKRIQTVREKLKMTQDELGEILSVSGASVSYYEKGREFPIDTAVKIATLGEVSVDWLLTGKDTYNINSVSDNIFKNTDSSVNQNIVSGSGNSIKNAIHNAAKSKAERLSDLGMSYNETEITNKLIDQLKEEIARLQDELRQEKIQKQYFFEKVVELEKKLSSGSSFSGVES